MVTPRVGVWIEILRLPLLQILQVVTPRVGVWIEIRKPRHFRKPWQSLPVWECGLKFFPISA